MIQTLEKPVAARADTTAPSNQDLSAGQRFVLTDIDYATYVKFSDLLPERHIRITYDGREMELMTLSPRHERDKHLLGLLVVELAIEMDLNIAGFGSMTCRHEGVERGLESDECYYLENEPLVRGRHELDLNRDPAPDLALEIEISRSALDRMEIYARLRIPEVWRWDGQILRVFLLQADGQYQQSERSRAFPFLPIAELVRFLALAATMNEAALVRMFRAWVREQVARGWASPAPPPPPTGSPPDGNSTTTP